MPAGSLTVVGTGIRVGAQTSPEARACIESADKVFFISADPLTERWLREINSTAEPLHRFYAPGKARHITYEEMIQCVLASVFEGLDVCLAGYGHPGVFAYPTHESIRRARAAGYKAKMLPGISADACLFADLGIDPGQHGYQSFEATDFLVYRRRFDSNSALVLWQFGLTGEMGYKNDLGAWNIAGVRRLVEELLRYYDAQHEVIVYQAGPYVCGNPSIERIQLAKLTEAKIGPLSTLYVPPRSDAEPDWNVVRELGLMEQLQEA